MLVRAGLLDAVDAWAPRFDCTRNELLDAVYGGNDDRVLIGRTTEKAWWELVRDRLGADVTGLRAAIEGNDVWDDDIVDAVRRARPRARTAILSNAWPSQRGRIADDLADEILLSCEIGVAKPDPCCFEIALERLGTLPSATLFVDDTPGHVEAARSLGIIGHVHTDAAGTLAAMAKFLDGG